MLFIDNTDISDQIDKYLRMIRKKDGSFYNKSTVKYIQEDIPSFGNEFERKRWWTNQIELCRTGKDGIAPIYYFFLMFCKIVTPQGKLIRPAFRRWQNDYCWEIEYRLRGIERNGKFIDKIGRGLIVPKRRRVGFTELMQAVLLHLCLFYKHMRSGQTSKSEIDVEEIFLRVKSMYLHLPVELKRAVESMTKKKIWFADVDKSDKNNIKVTGQDSQILCKSPVDKAFESMGLILMYIDEAGKIPNVKRILSLGLPSLNDEEGIIRKGLAVVGGTVGEVEGDVAEDEGFEYLYWANESYDLDRYFIPGWMGWGADEYGNEDVEANVRHILTDRRRAMKRSKKDFYDLIQQFPLTVEEAMMSFKDTVFELEVIETRLYSLQSDPIPIAEGYFEWVVLGKRVKFVPKTGGPVQILEHPRPGATYVGGSDPYDMKAKLKGSKAATYVVKNDVDLSPEDMQVLIDALGKAKTNREAMDVHLQFGGLPVLQHIDMPLDPNIFYEQSLMGAIYYSQDQSKLCKLLIERNRARMVAWFTDNHYTEFMSRAVQSKEKIGPDRLTYSTAFGQYMDDKGKKVRTGAVDDYIRLRCDKIGFVELLIASKEYDPESQHKKKDEVDAFGHALMLYNDLKLKSSKRVAKREFPKIGYSKKNLKLTTQN